MNTHTAHHTGTTSTITGSHKRKKPAPAAGPSLRASPFHHSGSGAVTQLLSDRQRTQLLSVAACLRLPAKTLIYAAEAPAGSIWIVESGVVKSTRELPSGKRHITAFLFAGDLF